MKTVEEQAKDYAEATIDQCYNVTIGMLKEYCATDFMQGVAFAQSWISVEKELPKNEMEIIAKNDYWKECFTFFIHGVKDENYLNQFTHWRPVERV